MSEQYKFAFYILCGLFLTVQVNCEAGGETTTEDDDATIAYTPAPTYDVRAVLNIDNGRYTTVSFHYEVHQMKDVISSEYCYDDYIKCLTTHTAPTPVCAMHTARYIITRNSYCEIYLDNCRIHYRFWRILGYGICYKGPLMYEYFTSR